MLLLHILQILRLPIKTYLVKITTTTHLNLGLTYNSKLKTFPLYIKLLAHHTVHENRSLLHILQINELYRKHYHRTIQTWIKYILRMLIKNTIPCQKHQHRHMTGNKNQLTFSNKNCFRFINLIVNKNQATFSNENCFKSTFCSFRDASYMLQIVTSKSGSPVLTNHLIRLLLQTKNTLSFRHNSTF